jgi:hypothetical protein
MSRDKRSNSRQNQKEDIPLESNKTSRIIGLTPLLTAIIAALGFIIVALINRSTTVDTTLKPIAATQTAEAALAKPVILLGRLQVTFLGINPVSLIGTGCPGDDGRGSVPNYHFLVQGVSPERQVVRIVVLGNVGTATWELPCSNAWALVANPDSTGLSWDIYVAAASEQSAYTIIFFYDDQTMTLGTAIVPG